jgi:nucleotide-binding universal stress UspA family protein
MQKILIAVDYSLTAQKVAEKGFALAKALDAQIVMLHVMAEPSYYATNMYDPIMGFGGFIQTTISSSDVSKILLDESHLFLNTIKIHLKDDNIQTEIKKGDAAEMIIETATELKSDIIVMGTHGRKWLDEILMGSVAHAVLKTSKIPVFIIPTKG